MLNSRWFAIALVTLSGIVAAPHELLAQRQQQQAGSTNGVGQGGTGLGSGTGAGFGGTTSGTTGGAGTTVQGGSGQQGQGPSGLGSQQPEFRAFGETNSQDASLFGQSPAEAFARQQQLQQRGGTFGPQFGQQFGNFGQGSPLGLSNRGTGQPAIRSRAERLRPRHRVAFSFAPVSAEAVGARLQTRMRPLRLQGRVQDAEFSLSEDGTLTLRGTAASAEDRELAAAVARLEPGVRRVDNQIVAPSPASDVPPSGLP